MIPDPHMKQAATLQYLRIAPRKVRAVADLVRGLTVNEAEAQLLYERRRPAKPLLKLLRSAVASARATKKTEPEDLYVESIAVDQGPVLKRFLPRARGVATPIQKKSSHVRLVLATGSVKRTARFKITVVKKAKLPPEEKPRGKKQAPPEERNEGRSDRKPEKSGFFRRFFRRKSI